MKNINRNVINFSSAFLIWLLWMNPFDFDLHLGHELSFLCFVEKEYWAQIFIHLFYYNFPFGVNCVGFIFMHFLVEFCDFFSRFLLLINWFLFLILISPEQSCLESGCVDITIQSSFLLWKDLKNGTWPSKTFPASKNLSISLWSLLEVTSK